MSSESFWLGRVQGAAGRAPACQLGAVRLHGRARPAGLAEWTVMWWTVGAGQGAFTVVGRGVEALPELAVPSRGTRNVVRLSSSNRRKT